MSPLLDDKKNRNTGLLGIAILAVLSAILFSWPQLAVYYSNIRTKTLANPTETRKKEFIIISSPETRPGLKGRLVQHLFSQLPYTAGRSPDEISIGFDQPVLLKGFLISVDCWKSTRLVEFAAGINQEPAYQTSTDADMLFHVSFATNKEAGKIDEHTWFPEPIALEPTDRLNVGAWIQNSTGRQQAVSPEIIVYYSVAQAPEPPRQRRTYRQENNVLLQEQIDLTN